MTSPLFSHMTNIYGFISTSKRTIITKPGKILCQQVLTLPCRKKWRHNLQVARQTFMTLSPFLPCLQQPNFEECYPAHDNYTITQRSRIKHLQFISTFVRTTTTKLDRMVYSIILLIKMMSLSVDHFKNNFGFTSTSTEPLSTKFGRMTEQYALTLSCM